MNIVTDVNVNSKIEDIFKDFKIGNITFPIFFRKSNDNTLSNYITYYSYTTRPNVFADDIPVSAITYLTIDVYTTNNFLNVISEIKKKLIENDFTWNDDGIPDYEEDTKLYHYQINFIKESGD